MEPEELHGQPKERRASFDVLKVEGTHASRGLRAVRPASKHDHYAKQHLCSRRRNASYHRINKEAMYDPMIRRKAVVL